MEPDLWGLPPLDLNLVQRCCVADILTRGARLFGDRVAVIDGDEEVSYRELEDRVNSAARGLLELGILSGQPVAVWMRNRVRFVGVFLACARTGRVFLPLNVMLAPEDIEWILGDAGVEVLVVDEEFHPALEEVAASLPGLHTVITAGDAGALGQDLPGVRVLGFAQFADPDTSPVEVIVEDRDALHCLYTSGTTSRPKGVLTSHLAVLVAVLSTALQQRMRRGDQWEVTAIVLPMFHTTALDCQLLPSLLTGGTAVLYRGFDPARFLSDVETHRISMTTLLPMMWEAAITHPDAPKRDLTSVRHCIYGMAPMAPERIEEIAACFPNAEVLLGSGQTEFTPPTVFQWAPHQREKPASWGPAVATVDVAIMGPEGALAPPGVEGEIVYRGPNAMNGYWKNVEANAAAFAHGWFHSGDVGYLDDEGVVWFTDRLKDIIKSGGENVSSVEVERVLLAHPSVAEAAVIGLPDNQWGEAVSAFVVPAAGAERDASALLAWARERLAGFKAPKRIDFVEVLPRTASGKVQKHQLRQSAGG